MADENTPAHLCIVAKAGGLVVVVAAFVVVVLVVMVVGKTCTKLFALSLCYVFKEATPTLLFFVGNAAIIIQVSVELITFHCFFNTYLTYIIAFGT